MSYSAHSIDAVTLAEILSFNWMPKTSIPHLSILLHFNFSPLIFIYIKSHFLCADAGKWSYARSSNMFFIVPICIATESKVAFREERFPSITFFFFKKSLLSAEKVYQMICQ